MPEIDPELLTVLRLLQTAFGDVEVLDVIDDEPATSAPAAQGWLFDEDRDEDEPGWSSLHEGGPGP